jgi:flagellar assembly factor FliW
MFLQLWLIIEHFIYLSSADKNCKAVGMPHSSLYYILDYNPDAPTEAQELYSTSNREQLE